LLEHGLIDMIVDRNDMKYTIAELLKLFLEDNPKVIKPIEEKKEE